MTSNASQDQRRNILIYNTGGTFSCDYDDDGEKLVVKQGVIEKWIQNHKLLAQFTNEFNFDFIESEPSFDSSQSCVLTWNRLITEIQNQLLNKILLAEENVIKQKEAPINHSSIEQVGQARKLATSIEQFITTQSQKTELVENEEDYERKADMIEDLQQLDQDIRSRLLELKEILRRIADEFNLEEIEELRRQSYSACVIIHGTDTLAYSGSVLSFGIVHADIPFVLTGSQFPMVFPNSDAPGNLYGSVLSSVEMVKRGVEGKFVFFDKYLMRATRVRKVHTNSVDAFESVNCPPVGQVQGNQVQLLENYFRGLQVKNLRYFPVPHIMKFSPSVQLLRIHPLFDIQDFRLITRRELSRVIILQTYGAGNVHRDIAKEIDSDRNNIYFSCSECYNGRCEDKYASAVDSSNCISLHDMTPEAALVKASFLMAKPLASPCHSWNEDTTHEQLRIILKEKIPNLMESTLRAQIFIGDNGSINTQLVEAIENVISEVRHIQHDEVEHLIDRADTCSEFVKTALYRLNKQQTEPFKESVLGKVVTAAAEVDDFMMHCAPLPKALKEFLEPSVTKSLMEMYQNDHSEHWKKITKRHIYQIEMGVSVVGEIINLESRKSLDGHLHANF